TPKLFAGTTNVLFTNQRLGIRFGTLGCSRGGTVTAQVVTFTTANAEALAREMALAERDSLDGLAELLNIKSEVNARFFSVSKQNCSEIYSEENQNTLQVLSTLQTVMAKDEVLKSYI